jgi:pimeloyl-ACP methyl ester carboxylesterase
MHVAGLQCATLDVPFDRADPAIGDTALAVQRIPASAPRVGVIVLLAGGPGQAALPPFEELLTPLAHDPALRGYELVAFDQRGTGQSQSLECLEEGSSKGGLTAYLGVCGSALGPTRAFYSSQESVEDLDALRRALGGTPLSLFAVSYGGRVAGMYAREYPQDVARIVLDSPEPVTGSGPLDSQRFRGLPRVLDEGICGSGACRSFSGDVYVDLRRVVAKLHHGPLHTRIYDEHGRLRSVNVTETRVLQLLIGLDLSQGIRELAPAAIAAAARGNAAPLARLTDALHSQEPGSSVASTPADATPSDTSAQDPLVYQPPTDEVPENAAGISLALFAATYCRENELPWSPESPPAGRSAALHGWLASLPAESTAPFAPATVVGQSALSLCLGWPSTPPAPPSPAGMSATPTLILSGDDDLRTPYEQDLAVAAGYSDMRLLRVPGVGHSTVSSDRTGCAKHAMIAFIATGIAPSSCTASREPQALPLPPASIGELRPLPARSRLVGQVAAAVALTLEDLYGQNEFSGGGLRGGYYRLQGTKVIIHDLVDVPGVIVSGSISMRGVTHLTLRGRLSGTLTIKDFVLTGDIGGAKIHLHLVAT